MTADRGEAAPRQAVPRRWQAAIIVAFGLGGVTVTSWGPRMPAVQKELAASTATIGALLACVTVGSICGLLLSTPFLHRFGNRRTVGGAILTAALGMAGIGAGTMAGSDPVVACAFAVTGLGIGLMDVLINVEASEIERRLGRIRMPLMHGAWSVGAAAGAGIGAACSALRISAAHQFLGEAVLLALVSVPLVRAIPLRREEAGKREPRLARLARWARGWLDWRLLLIGAVMLGVEFGEGSANSWLSLAAHGGHGFDATTAAALLIVFAISEAGARIFGGPVVDRIGRPATIRLTAGIGIVGVALFILGGSPVLIIAGVALWAAGVSMGFPLGMSAAAEGADAVSRVSVVASIGYFASLAGPPVVGVIAEQTGLITALWLVAVLFAAAFLASGSLRPAAEAPRTRRPPAAGGMRGARVGATRRARQPGEPS
ncbi:MAG TPA: MFS transporter [Microbacteriaceae bacterium]|nr:MFS transporter [Microbacteriaceae bacterium]